jgi:hypothetical protein
MFSKRFTKGEDHTKGVFIHHLLSTTSIHVHILIWLYGLFSSLDPVFDFAIYVMQVCVILHTYLKLHT